ncbi:MAG: hypothetical protein C0603_05950 [Denitrovibrio sp.]|nr:MAG: hypothetical protein C0603_05950 [Denitrovibrio sp.]
MTDNGLHIMKKVLILLLAIFIAEGSIYFALSNFRERRINTYYETQSFTHKNNFTSAVAAYEQIFTNVFKDRIDVDEVKVLINKAQTEPKSRDKYRNWLRMYTQPIFESMKSVGLTHMHYHLPDGTSFLRMHKPFFFGDDISSFRKSIVTVIKNHKMVAGFENGRHLLAYRYIFTIKYEGAYIGSVELSIGLEELVTVMNRLYGIGYSYLLQKDKVIKNYTGQTVSEFDDLSISDDYFMGTCDDCISGKEDTCSSAVDIRNQLMNSINGVNSEKIKAFEEFSEVDKEYHKLLLSYMSIVDINGEGLGYLISHSFVEGYDDIVKIYNLLFFFLSIGAVSIIFVFYGLYNSHEKIKEMNESLASKVEEKVRELRDKEQFFAQQSKMVTVGEMMASILHQWKQPLSSISLLADLTIFDIEQNKIDGEVLENIKHIKEQTTFMSQTGRDFTNFLKPSQEKSVFNIIDSIEDVLNLFEFSFTRFNVGFENNWTDDTKVEARVYGYANEFKHVLLNLFNNSRDAIVRFREKHVSDGEDVSDFLGVISVRVTLSEDKVVVKVADTGGGIPQEEMGHVFDKYFSTKEEQGSGIGLYMSKEMIETSMNGQISVQNVFGGAEFTIILPIA